MTMPLHLAADQSLGAEVLRPSLKPILKWPGGKRWLADELRRLYVGHEHRLYQEPFAGGIAAAFALRPERAVLGDINRWLINFYGQVKNDSMRPRTDLGNNEDDYYSAREEFNALTKQECWDTPEAGELFFYLNKTCFNGLCRFNQSGQFNSPFGRYKSVNYSMEFDEHRAAMRRWHFDVDDFHDALLQPESFVYCDPPYPNTFDSYSGTRFSWHDQVDLAYKLAEHDGPVVVSNSATPEVIQLYHECDFRISRVRAVRSISARAKGRKSVEEILATRNV